MSNDTILPSTKINVGTPGNFRTLSLIGDKTWTVAEVLNAAEINAEGYQIRVNGVPATAASTVAEGQTVMLLAPVRGNLEEAVITPKAVVPVEAPSTIRVNVGTPGNFRTLTLSSDKPWSVAEVLNVAEINAEGYQMRVDGVPATGATFVADKQTVMLLAPVRGN